jgi:hypothetical protein
MKNKTPEDIFDREGDRLQGMIEMLEDYLDTVDNEGLEDSHNVKKWVAAELIMFLAGRVGETHYEIVGILDECKWDLRRRSHEAMNIENTED